MTASPGSVAGGSWSPTAGRIPDDIYYSRKRLDSALAALSIDSSVIPANKTHILEYIQFSFAKGIKPIRLRKTVYMLRDLSRILQIDFGLASKKEVQSVIVEIENRSYAEWTKCDYKIILKRFYRWLLGNDEEFPEQVKWIKSREPKNSLLPEQILTQQDILNLVNSVNHPRDKAFIMTIYESGTRIGELLPLKLKHLTFNEEMSSIFVTGKTGPRRVPIVLASSYLAQWLNMHPFKHDPEAFVWSKLINRNQQNRTANQEITYSGAKKILLTAFRNAGLSKPSFFHIFRHSRATHMSNSLTESQLKQYFGWTLGSDMTARYIHLAGRDIDSAIRKMYGFSTVEDKVNVLQQFICGRCHEKNVPTALFCQRCGLKVS